jgi:hypothetical protein
MMVLHKTLRRDSECQKEKLERIGVGGGGRVYTGSNKGSKVERLEYV